MSLRDNLPFGPRYRMLKKRLHPITKEWGLTFYVLRHSKLAVVGAIIVFSFIFIAIFGSLLAPYDPVATTIQERFQGPSASHPFGTDKMGRDVLSRMLAGAQHSIKAGAIVLAIAVPLGVILGGVAGLFGGWID